MSEPKSRLTAVFSGFCLALPVLGLLASLGVVPLLLIAAVLAGIIVWRSKWRLLMPDLRLILILGALLLWCAVASLWGFDLADSLVLVLRIAVIFAAGLLLWSIAGVLDDTARERIGRWFLIGIAITLAIMVAEVAFDFPLFRLLKGPAAEHGNQSFLLNRGATAMALLCWPGAAFLWQRGLDRAALALPLVVGVILVFLASLAAILGLAAGFVGAVAALGHRKAGRALLVLATVGALTAGPIIGKTFYSLGWHEADWLPASTGHRVEIWNDTVDWISERPVQGWGFDASRAIGKFKVRSVDTERQLMPLHPHNAGLQVLLELGLVGGAVVFVLLWFLAGRLETLPPPSRICGQALFMATLAVATVGFGLWQNWWLALMISAALMVSLTQHQAVQAEAIGEAVPGRAQPRRGDLALPARQAPGQSNLRR
jgi:O-antigen ligase